MKTLLSLAVAAFAAYQLSVSTVDRSTLTRANIHYPGGESVGAIEYRSRTGAWVMLPIGAAGDVLTVSSAGVPSWVTPA